jgi:hypothetical protein
LATALPSDGSSQARQITSTSHQHHVERQEKRVIETGHDQAHQALQDNGKAADHQAGQRLLHRAHVEEAVEQVTPPRIDEERVLRVDGTRGDLGHQPREEALLEPRHHRHAQGHQRPRQQQQGKQHQRQREQRRGQRDIGHRVDQQLHRNRRGQRQQRDRRTIDQRQAEEGLVGRQDQAGPAPQIAQRQAMGVMAPMVSTMIGAVMGRMLVACTHEERPFLPG